MSLIEAPLPPGLLYFPDWLSDAEHDSAVSEIDSHEFETGLARRVQHYGVRYDYGSAQIAKIGSAPPIPKNLYLIGEKLFKECNFERIPEQVIVNEYKSEQGIAAHIDKDSFGPMVATISLIENWYMTFLSPDGREAIDVLLAKNSLAIMTGASRSQWTHEIKKRKNEKIGGLTTPRIRRLSITFRTINPPRYWKRVVDGTIEGIYRLENGKFEKYSQNKWQISDRYESAKLDPEFIETNELEANKLIG